MNKTYLKNIVGLLEKLEATQETVIDRIAEVCAESIYNGGLLYFFGTGHSHMICEEPFYRAGGLVINDDTKEVTVEGELVKLTPIEYNILLLLLKNQGRVFSIDQIYENIWEEEAIGADNTVAVHIRHIREKIEINPKEPRYLKVVWGVGYKIEKQ